MTTASGRMKLVLLPGLDGTCVFFRPLLTALPPWVEPIVVEYPPDGRNDYEHLLAVVSDAVQRLDAYWVLGWSFSGPLALMLAAQDPHRVRGVILCASFVRAPRRGLPWCRFVVVGPIFWMVRVARRVPSFLSRTRRPRTWSDKAETWARVSAATLARRIRAALAVDARHVLRRCQATVVYLASSRDALVPRRNADEIVQQKPSTSVVVVEGPQMASAAA
jgi:pimeloyl-ACP methyl ester carboxylesterase